MKQLARINHVAFLVRSVEECADLPGLRHFPRGEAETFEGEGTREIYMGPPGSTARLLLLQAIQSGPYQRALAKRGPGLHHIAVDVFSLSEYLATIECSGWLLHPHSLKSIPASKTAYLARPGVPTLIEVQERRSFSPGSPFIQSIDLPLSESGMRIMASLGAEGIRASRDGQVWLQIGTERVPGALFQR